MTYKQAHNRVRDLWGPAKNYGCVMCPQRADHWAYDWCDDTSENYSMWPEFYMPLCQRCHARFDKSGGSHPNRLGRAFRPKPITTTPKTEQEWDAYLRERKRSRAHELRANGKARVRQYGDSGSADVA